MIFRDSNAYEAFIAAETQRERDMWNLHVEPINSEAAAEGTPSANFIETDIAQAEAKIAAGTNSTDASAADNEELTSSSENEDYFYEDYFYIDERYPRRGSLAGQNAQPRSIEASAMQGINDPKLNKNSTSGEAYRAIYLRAEGHSRKTSSGGAIGRLVGKTWALAQTARTDTEKARRRWFERTAVTGHIYDGVTVLDTTDPETGEPVMAFNGTLTELDQRGIKRYSRVYETFGAQEYERGTVHLPTLHELSRADQKAIKTTYALVGGAGSLVVTGPAWTTADETYQLACAIDEHWIGLTGDTLYKVAEVQAYGLMAAAIAVSAVAGRKIYKTLWKRDRQIREFPAQAMARIAGEENYGTMVPNEVIDCAFSQDEAESIGLTDLPALLESVIPREVSVNKRFMMPTDPEQSPHVIIHEFALNNGSLHMEQQDGETRISVAPGNLAKTLLESADDTALYWRFHLVKALNNVVAEWQGLVEAERIAHHKRRIDNATESVGDTSEQMQQTRWTQTLRFMGAVVDMVADRQVYQTETEALSLADIPALDEPGMGGLRCMRDIAWEAVRGLRIDEPSTAGILQDLNCYFARIAELNPWHEDLKQLYEHFQAQFGVELRLPSWDDVSPIIHASHIDIDD